MTRRFLLIAGYAPSLINFRWHLMLALQEDGFEVHAAAPSLSADSEIHQRLVAQGIQAHDVPMQRNGMDPLADLATLKALYRLMRHVSPTHVMGYTIKPVIYGSLAARFSGIPFRFSLITGLGYAFIEDSMTIKRRALQRCIEGLYRLAMACSHTVFFQNPDDMQLFIDRKILGKTYAVVVNGSGVDIEHFGVTALPDTPVFVLVARLFASKGIREYAEAARLLRQEYPQVRFQLVGEPDLGPDAIAPAELQAWLTDGRLEYLGQLDDVRPAIASATTVVLPSYYREGIPRTLLEGLSMGRAIITTDTPGCRETVQEGYNGHLVSPRCVISLVNAMRRMIEQPDRLQAMGIHSRRIAEERFEVTRVNTVMLEEINAI
ncbi:glycosyltransferase family 4 protein [Halomonas sp. KAO]|uniref:glycosyltransferase family 4 protein n=1 Tax=unclassified Halomonas TaxID=2609666 RepID=UPI00189D28E8|nr:MULTISPECIES: glycosyltransferase family 4 protein [unclassified Halomonas]MBF7053203.1 glycosyltransferase family 4 protein [Halomonas sp. KAO]MDT0499408.1 glycosyltransferase family 4 protein [Halomonas sp. PAR7]MDT0510775.1 glycosyltransferase family 4 protein [Halomonas sp. LES1]